MKSFGKLKRQDSNLYASLAASIPVTDLCSRLVHKCPIGPSSKPSGYRFPIPAFRKLKRDVLLVVEYNPVTDPFNGNPETVEKRESKATVPPLQLPWSDPIHWPNVNRTVTWAVRRNWLRSKFERLIHSWSLKQHSQMLNRHSKVQVLAVFQIGGSNTNDFGFRVENWATTTSWGNRRGYLNQLSSSMFSEGAYDPLRERPFQTMRAAYGKHFIAH